MTALLANTPAQAELRLERAAAGISPHVNADKTEYMCFNQGPEWLALGFFKICFQDELKF